MGRSATLASSCVCVCVWQWWFLNLWSGSHGRPPGRLAALEAGGPAYYYSLKPPKVRLLQHVSEWSCLLYFDSSCGCSCLSLSLSVCIHSHSVSAFWLTNGWIPYLASLISGSRPAGGSLDQHEIFFSPDFSVVLAGHSVCVDIVASCAAAAEAEHEWCCGALPVPSAFVLLVAFVPPADPALPRSSRFAGVTVSSQHPCLSAVASQLEYAAVLFVVACLCLRHVWTVE